VSWFYWSGCSPAPHDRPILFPAGRRCRRAVEGEAFVAAPIGGSLIVVVATALFTVIVFRTSRA
jgi:hypothetical protein